MYKSLINFAVSAFCDVKNKIREDNEIWVLDFFQEQNLTEWLNEKEKARVQILGKPIFSSRMLDNHKMDNFTSVLVK